MLTLSVRFLTGHFVSSEFYDFNKPEWPPHPARAFFALVSSLHEAGSDIDLGHEALEWLERQDPPEVYASEKAIRRLGVGEGEEGQTPVTVYVPVNPVNSLKLEGIPISEGIPILRERQDRTFPTAVPYIPLVYFVWRGADPPEGYLKALSELAGRVSYLGHSSSLVSLQFIAAEPGPEVQGLNLNRYVPSEDGEVMLRAPRQGLLSELERSYPNRGEEKVQLPYRPVGYTVVGQQPSRARAPALRGPFDPRLIIYRGSGTSPSVTATFRVTSALRGAFISKASAAGIRIPEYVSGHRDDGTATDRLHMAIVPLPNVGFSYSDGSLKGVAFALPSGLQGGERAEAMRVIASLGEEVILRMGQYGEWRLTRDPLGGGLVALSRETWIGPSRRWATVTPIVLDRFPNKLNSDESRGIIALSCARAGLPIPSSVEISQFSPFRGVPSAREFVPYRKEGLPPRLHVHAVLEFEEEIQGPVLLGAGRFLGMGMLRPLSFGSGGD